MPPPKVIHKFSAKVDSLLKGKTTKPVIGRAIFAQRLRRIGDLAPNGRPIEETRAFIIKKGDQVPVEIQGIPGLQLGPNGIASRSYTDAWSQSTWNDGGTWKDSWNDRWDNSVARLNVNESTIVFNTLKNKVKAFSLKEFTPAELKIISDMGV